MKQPFNSFLIGFRTLFVGLKLIRSESKILKLAIIPFIIDFLVLALTFFWGSSKISDWVKGGMSWLFPEMSGFWEGLIYYPVYVLAWLVFIVMLFFLGYIVAALIAAPFNSLLAEKTLMHLGVIQKEPFSFQRWVKISIKMLWAALLKTFVFLGLGLIFFGVSFIPVVGLIATLGIVLVMAFDSADYSFEILEYPLGRRFHFFNKNFFYFLGSATALGLTLLVPGLSFLLLPVAVVGHAELVAKNIQGNTTDVSQ